MNDLVEHFNELDLHCALVSETWMKDGHRFDSSAQALVDSQKIGIYKKNRHTTGEE